MGDDAAREQFLTQVRKGCRIARTLRQIGIRPYGVVRIDSACSPSDWAANPKANTQRIADTFRKACDIAEEFGERLAAEGEICWGGMHSARHMVELLEAVEPARKRSASRPTWPTRCSSCWATTRRKIASCRPTSSWNDTAAFDAGYKKLTDALRPWTIDFHVAQNNGEVFGSGIARQDRPPLPAQRAGRQDRHRQVRRLLAPRRKRQARPPLRAHLLGRLHVPQRNVDEPANVERYPRRRWSPSATPTAGKNEADNHRDTESTENAEFDVLQFVIQFYASLHLRLPLAFLATSTCF